MERAPLAAIHKKAVEIVEEFVPDRALDFPLRAQLLVRRHDLLRHHIEGLLAGMAFLLDPLEVASGIEQAVGVIDAQAADTPLVDQLEPETVYGAKDVAVLDANRGELVDVEEAPVV